MKRFVLVFLAAAALCGSMVFLGVAESGADGYTGTPACTISLTGTDATGTYGNVGSGSVTSVGFSLLCSGQVAAYSYEYVTWDGELYQINYTAYPSTTSNPFSQTVAAGATVPTGWHIAWWPYNDAFTTGAALTWADVGCSGHSGTPTDIVVTYVSSYSCFNTAVTFHIAFGTVVLPVSGPAGQCTPTGESGFFSGTANGTETYTWTLDFSGEAEIIAADPEDGSTPQVNNNGFNFSANTAFESPSAALGYSPLASTIFITTRPAAGANPDAVHFYCFDQGQWYDWGTPASGGSGTLPNPPGCAGVAFLDAPTDNVVNGTLTATVSVTPSAHTGAILLDPNNGGTATEAVAGGGTMLWEPDVDWELLAPGSETTAFQLSVTQTAAASGPPTLWCYDLTTSSWVNEGNYGSASLYGVTSTGGAGTGGGTAGDGGCFDLSEHLATSGMSLTDPVSWVTGLAKDVGFVVEWAFVPCTSTWDQLENNFGLGGSNACSGTSQASMTQLVGCASAALTVDPASDVGDMKAAADSGSCSGVAGSSTDLVVAGVHLNGCTLAADSSSSYYSSGASSILSWFATLLSLVVYALAALLVFHLLRRVLGGGGE